MNNQFAGFFVRPEGEQAYFEYIANTSAWMDSVRAVFNPDSPIDWGDKEAVKKIYNNFQEDMSKSNDQKIAAGLVMPYSLVLPEDYDKLITALTRSTGNVAVNGAFPSAIQSLTAREPAPLLICTDIEQAKKELFDENKIPLSAHQMIETYDNAMLVPRYWR